MTNYYQPLKAQKCLLFCFQEIYITENQYMKPNI